MRIRSALAIVASSLALGSSALVSPASAVTPCRDRQHHDRGARHHPDGGWVAFNGTGSSRAGSTGVSAYTVTSVGGGTLSYGATLNAAGQKVRYSQYKYKHNSTGHGSSVNMSNLSDSDYVAAGEVSYAPSRSTPLRPATPTGASSPSQSSSAGSENALRGRPSLEDGCSPHFAPCSAGWCSNGCLC